MHKISLGLTVLTICFGLALCFPQSAAFADCLRNTKADSLISSGDTANGIVGLGNPGGVCIVNNAAGFSQTDIPSFADFKQLFYLLPKSLPNTVATKPKFNYPAEIARDTTEADFNNTGGETAANGGNTVYSVHGNTTIGSGMTLQPSSTVVIFIDGNLNINADIKQQVNNNKAVGIVFVVNGVVNVASSVVQIDAAILAYGDAAPATGYSICTSLESGGNCPQSAAAVVPNTQKLIVNGLLASLDPAEPIRFRRNLQNNTEAAEQVLYDPRYLVLLKDVFSQAKKIESEVADYDPSKVIPGVPASLAVCPGQCSDAQGNYNGGICTNINTYGATSTCSAPTQYCSSGCSRIDCDDIPQPVGACTVNTGQNNTCTGNNGTQQYQYTKYKANPAIRCTPVPAYTQPCSANFCTGNNSCINGQCVTPACNTGLQTTGSCSAPTNTCSSNNGTQTAQYTTYNNSPTTYCTPTAAPSQACTVNTCTGSNSCINGQCITPNCNTGYTLTSSCNAPSNTCSANNGYQTAKYTTYNNSLTTCTQVAAPNQSCTQNTCTGSNSCISGQCITPNCNTGAQASGSCTAPTNTCSVNNGTQAYIYTTYNNSSITCNRVSAPSQPCSVNTCTAGNSCYKGTGSCIQSTWTLANGFSSNQGPMWYYYAGGNAMIWGHNPMAFWDPNWISWYLPNHWNYVLPSNIVGDNTLDTYLFWKAPYSGTATMTANIQNPYNNPSDAGNGFTVGEYYSTSLGNPGTQLGSTFIYPLDTSVHTLTRTHHVYAGEYLMFWDNANGDPYHDDSSLSVTVNITPD